ncbi:FkbM family methyltransferase [Bradyrhizobium sp. NC92]|uniref:FkbM family methyltransferase n=1 Tax=Bradyrhizobium sp. (strain NC92) TaxID=55395 RepID=UPI0021A9B1A2|nr:FkbM family methyltransferase [Bradyrhizobium sp. NC92]UWU67626.1 FkbM family methyltransferase [Bradyrhizobium sp. NC92]
MNWRQKLLQWRASPLGEKLIGLADFDIRWRIQNVNFPVYLQASKNLSEILTGSGKETAERALFRSIASRSEMREFWDVGANIGQYTWEFLSSGPEKRAILFEPDDRNVKTIRRTISKASLDSCKIEKKAVSDRVGTIEFKRDTITGKQGTIVTNANIERVMGRPAHSIQITCTTIDHVSRQTNRSPDLIKIDVEGAEQAVIDGGTDVFSKDRPLVFIEVLASNFPEIESKFQAWGYRLFDAILRRPANAHSFNLVAISPDRHPRLFSELFTSAD